jgi:hypothetical protein
MPTDMRKEFHDLATIVAQHLRFKGIFGRSKLAARKNRRNSWSRGRRGPRFPHCDAFDILLFDWDREAIERKDYESQETTTCLFRLVG